MTLRILLLNNYEAYPKAASRMEAMTKALFDASESLGMPIDLLVVRADECDFDRLPSFNAVVLSGGPSNPTREAIRSGWLSKESQWLRKVCEKGETPVLAICFGFEILGTTFGATLSARKGGKADTFLPVHRVKNDPLLEGEKTLLRFSHEWELTGVPDGFDLVAEGKMPASRIQLIRMRGKKVWGVQGHPEMGGDGLGLIQRFLKAIR